MDFKKSEGKEKSGKIKRSIQYYCVCRERVEKYIERKRKIKEKKRKIYTSMPILFFSALNAQISGFIDKLSKNIKNDVKELKKLL